MSASSTETARPLSVHAATPLRRPLAFKIWFYWTVAAKITGTVLFLRGHHTLAPFVFFSGAPWLLWQFLVPTSHGFGPAIRRFRTDRLEIWLTIDDGPDPATTPRVLDLLDQHRARATFFLIGENAARHPALVVEILRRGHTLGNHTHTHPHGTYWGALPSATGAQMDNCDAAIRAVGAPSPRWFRPPVGLKSLSLHPQLAKRGLELVLWSARGYDTQTRDPDAAVRRIRHSLTPGAIILAHESGPPGSPRVEVIARLLARLTADGYRCVIPSAESLERT
ncbi:polysaccharide deacetylase family protein [Nibricoccus aquaticus]|uniref:polysaccharide deacetylase family protein n=1 Tax=Nibricoccus aquaticus TaxID=2576891 RepID=UPI00158688C5|nr:polysaccharide deacetylase family protein [Nibricoccus aquaticus]